MINFKEITNANIWKVCTLEPFEEQKDFVAENIQSLAEAYATRNEGGNALPLAVYNDETLVGFIMIGKGTVGNEKESELIKKNYSLWRLMIDKKYQGKGFGRQTLDAAMALIRTYPFGKADKVWLSYEPENVRAREIYRKYGFVENGEMCGNEIIAVYDLIVLASHKEIATMPLQSVELEIGRRHKYDYPAHWLLSIPIEHNNQLPSNSPFLDMSMQGC